MLLPRTSVVASVAFLLALGAATSAQISEAQAVSALKSACKTKLTEVKAGLKGTQAGLDGALDAFEASVKAEGATLEDLDALFATLKDFQSEVAATVAERCLELDIAACEQLGLLQGEGDLQGHYPRDFHPQGDGALETFRAGVEKAVAKAYVAANKRLSKTLKLLAGTSGLLVNALLAPPLRPRDNAPGPDVLVQPVTLPAGIDVVLAASFEDADGDGLLIIGGSADLELGDVTVAWWEAEGLGPAAGVAEPSGLDGFAYATTADLSEGVYTLWATQGTGGASVTASIGIR